MNRNRLAIKGESDSLNLSLSLSVSVFRMPVPNIWFISIKLLIKQVRQPNRATINNFGEFNFICDHRAE